MTQRNWAENAVKSHPTRNWMVPIFPSF